MNVVTWLRSLFGSRRIIRDVSVLSVGAVDDDAATKQETIVLDAGPLKPGSQRRAIRDRRLLPKPKPTTRIFGRKKNVLSRDEADRLFSATMRTRDRSIRDLASDTEQLDRYGLPQWLNESDVANALDVTVKQLRHYSIHRQREATPHYVTFAIPKRSGGQRLIHAPKRRLKAIQRKLHELLIARLPVSPYAHGFRTGRSVASNAAPHVGKGCVIKLDLADCFPSIHFGRVRSLLVAYGYSYPVAQVLAVLMTEPPRQPVEIEGQLYHVPVGPRVCVQGAPTSPGVCNAVLRRMDFRLAGLGKRYGFAFTRYADDLTFSGDDTSAVKAIITLACRIVREEGFAVNREKTRVMRAGRRQTVTGVTVNKVAGLSRRERRRLRAAIHQRNQADTPDSVQDRRLRGKLAYLRMLNPAQADALLRDKNAQPPAVE
ncbi:MAG: reverse transcriptase family protein [Pirellulaceae bacterium]